MSANHYAQIRIIEGLEETISDLRAQVQLLTIQLEHSGVTNGSLKERNDELTQLMNSLKKELTSESGLLQKARHDSRESHGYTSSLQRENSTMQQKVNELESDRFRTSMHIDAMKKKHEDEIGFLNINIQELVTQVNEMEGVTENMANLLVDAEDDVATAKATAKATIANYIRNHTTTHVGVSVVDRDDAARDDDSITDHAGGSSTSASSRGSSIAAHAGGSSIAGGNIHVSTPFAKPAQQKIKTNDAEITVAKATNTSGGRSTIARDDASTTNHDDASVVTGVRSIIRRGGNIDRSNSSSVVSSINPTTLNNMLATYGH